MATDPLNETDSALACDHLREGGFSTKHEHARPLPGAPGLEMFFWRVRMADADEHPTITYLSEQDYSTGPIPHLVERTCCVDFLVAEPRRGTRPSPHG